MSIPHHERPTSAASGSPQTAWSWADGLARWTIRHAARRAPPPLSERLEEEWLADLEARPRPWSRLLLGIGCCWAAAVIVQEHLAPGLTAASTTGNKVMSSYARTDISLVPQRTTALLVIIGLHVALIFAFATGLAPKVARELPSMIQAKFLTPDTPREAPPPPPQPSFKPTRVEIPEPEWPVIQTGTDAIVNTVPHDPTDLVPPSPPEPKAVHRVQGGPGKGFPNTGDFYPASAARLGETGTTAVNVCVDATGHLTGNPTLAQSSGSARLDEGALKLARAGSGHYRPTTEDGRPVDACYPYRITFQFRD